MKQTKQELVALAKSGDAHAFALLYQEIYKDLYHFAYCMMKDEHKAEDIVSESVLTAYENIHKLRKAESFRSWIFQITANECKKQFRLQARINPVPDEELPLQESTSDFTEQIIAKEAFSLLNEEEKFVVGLSVFAGYTGKEIARFLRKKEGTIRSTKSRALDKMKHFLEVK